MSKVTYIDAPEMLTRRQRTFGTIVTAVMWAIYAYLWLPLLSLAAWSLGIEFAYDVMMRAGGASALRTALFWYAIALVDVIVTVAVWSLINKWRFAGRNRRTAHEHVPDDAMAEYFGVTMDDLKRLRSAQRVEIEIDALGRPLVPAPNAGRGSLPKQGSALTTAA